MVGFVAELWAYVPPFLCATTDKCARIRVTLSLACTKAPSERTFAIIMDSNGVFVYLPFQFSLHSMDTFSLQYFLLFSTNKFIFHVQMNGPWCVHVLLRVYT